MNLKEEHLSRVFQSIVSLDMNLSNILKHISDKDGYDDNPTPPFKKPKYCIHMYGDGSGSSSVIKIDDIEHKPLQIYRLKAGFHFSETGRAPQRMDYWACACH